MHTAWAQDGKAVHVRDGVFTPIELKSADHLQSWTEQEKALLRVYTAGKFRSKTVAEFFPGRSFSAVATAMSLVNTGGRSNGS